VRAVHVPVGSDFRADPVAMEAAITTNTILMAGSAPAYPHGVIDPIPELAAIAASHGLLFHTDACVGGLVLPFARKLGYPIPDFDLRVPGVTSISADLHKYGYSAKGASVILFKTRELRRHMFFAVTEWPGGVYASATLSGTRPGGAIAAAWAVMNFLGEEGYLALTRQVMETADKIRAGIRLIPDLVILGDPLASVMAIGAQTLDIYAIADEMTARGWHLDRQHLPACLHLTVQPGHAQVVDAFLADLAGAVEHVRRAGLANRANRWLLTAANALARRLPERWLSRLTTRASAMLGGGDGLPKRSSAMYGLIGTLPNRGDVKELVFDLLDSMTRINPNGGKS
jgi:sphinganine-1-phosphate aldolase